MNWTLYSDPRRQHPQAARIDETEREQERERLAILFASEPELVVACLEAGAEDAMLTPQLILAAAELALRRQPSYADLHYYTALAAVEAQALDTARTHLATALQVNPRYNDALILAARVSTLQGQSDEALAYLRQALFNGADYADVHLMMGDLWRARNDLAQAELAYSRALEINARFAAASERLSSLRHAGEAGGTA